MMTTEEIKVSVNKINDTAKKLKDAIQEHIDENLPDIPYLVAEEETFFKKVLKCTPKTKCEIVSLEFDRDEKWSTKEVFDSMIIHVKFTGVGVSYKGRMDDKHYEDIEKVDKYSLEDIPFFIGERDWFSGKELPLEFDIAKSPEQIEDAKNIYKNAQKVYCEETRQSKAAEENRHNQYLASKERERKYDEERYEKLKKELGL